MAGNDYLVVVVIDIGSAFSGYVYKFRSDGQRDQTKNIIWPQWKSSNNKAGGKTASTLLLNPDGSFNSFGFDAEDVYNEMWRKYHDEEFHDDKFPGKLPKDWFLFKNFKMELYGKKTMHRNMRIKDDTGKSFSLRAVFTESIRFFKKHALDAITRQTTVLPSDVLWVLTIPAICSEPAEQFMRKAAEEAGIPGESLTLALEPEAAALFTKQQELIRQSKDGRDNLVPFVPKSKFIVVDLGGETGAITVFEVQKDHTFQMINMATGGPWGEDKINEAFLGIWKDILQDEFTECLQQNPEACLELQQNFERQKRSIDEKNQKQHLYISLPIVLREVEDIKRKLQGSIKYSGIRYERGKVEFPLQMIQDLYKESIRDIISQISQLMKNNAVDAIILVGGFSESTFVYKSIKYFFEPPVIVLSPPECGLSVLKGAVLYGFHPEQISKRVSRYSYGFSISKPFDPVLHNNERDRVHKHYDKLEDVFLPIIRAGDPILPNETREYKCHPPDGIADFTLVEFYSTLDKDPKYVKEPEPFIPEFCCHHIGDIKVEHGRQDKFENDEILVKVVFRLTQLSVRAEYTIAGEKKQVRAQFELLK